MTGNMDGDTVPGGHDGSSTLFFSHSFPYPGPTIFSRLRPAAVVRPARKLMIENLEARDVPAAFTLGDLALLVATASASNTTGSVVEINTSTANQSAVQTIALPGTGAADSYRISGSASSTGYVARSNDHPLLAFTGANSTDTTTNVNALNPRGVCTVTKNGAALVNSQFTQADVSAGDTTAAAVRDTATTAAAGDTDTLVLSLTDGTSAPISVTLNIAVVAVERDPLLPVHEREPRPEFQQERLDLPQDGRFEVAFGERVFQPQEVQNVRVAEDQVRRQRAGLPQGFQLLLDQFLRLLGNGRALVEHRPDALLGRALAPPFEPAHFRVKVSLQGVF